MCVCVGLTFEERRCELRSTSLDSKTIIIIIIIIRHAEHRQSDLQLNYAIKRRSVGRSASSWKGREERVRLSATSVPAISCVKLTTNERFFYILHFFPCILFLVLFLRPGCFCSFFSSSSSPVGRSCEVKRTHTRASEREREWAREWQRRDKSLWSMYGCRFLHGLFFLTAAFSSLLVAQIDNRIERLVVPTRKMIFHQPFSFFSLDLTRCCFRANFSCRFLRRRCVCVS